jgi:GTPase SAR1 family protein
MNRQELEQQIQSIRAILRDTYSRIISTQNSYIPTPDMSVKTAGAIIQQEQYDVVVCGEVKKGKSSFINALMGDEVLPTNTQVATSQVFRIINSDIEEYSLVFTDGQRQRISRKDLSRYGSQVDADLYGEPIFRGRQLDYIEVKHPIPSLPKSVALTDTPGIGALYAAHEQITRNYLSKAAAVIFIIDPKNPIVVKEREFIESALKVTKQIMFVMTKMDNYDEHVIATMISRNEEILAPYGKQTAFGRISIQPVSSTLLFDANKEKDEILMEMSCFEEVRDTLLKMIYNTVGFGISAEVFNAFNQYNTRVIQSLSELQTAAAAAPTMARELAEKKQQKQQEFIQNWGANGAKMKDINDSIRKHIQAMENNARALFSQSNPIITNLQREIDELSSSSQAEALSRNLSSRLADAYGKAWKDIMEECEDNVENLLIQYNAHLCDVDLGDSYVGVDSYQAKSRSLVDRLTSGRNSYFTGAFVASVFAAPLAIVAAPITLVIAGIGALLGIGAGIMTKRDSELKQWKQNLKEHLSKCYSQIYDNFMVKTENGKTKLHVAEEEIMSQSMKAIQNIYEQHKSNVDKQLQLLEQQMQADAQSKKQKMDEVAHIQQTWKPIHENLVKAKTLLAQMDQKRKSL